MPTKTELIWDGKYDANGKRVAPLRVTLPFQTGTILVAVAPPPRASFRSFGPRTRRVTGRLSKYERFLAAPPPSRAAARPGS